MRASIRVLLEEEGAGCECSVKWECVAIWNMLQVVEGNL